MWTLIGPWVHACVMYADLCAHRREYSIWPVPLITSDRNLTLRLAAGMCIPWSSRKSRGSYEALLGLSCCLSSLLSQAQHQLCGLCFCPDTLRVCSDVSHKCQIPRSPTLPSHHPFFRLGDSQKSGKCLRLDSWFLLTHPAQEQLGEGCSEQAMLGFTLFSYATLPPPCCSHQPQSVQILLGRASQPSLKSGVGDRSVYPLFSSLFVTSSSLSMVGLDQLIS